MWSREGSRGSSARRPQAMPCSGCELVPVISLPDLSKPYQHSLSCQGGPILAVFLQQKLCWGGSLWQEGSTPASLTSEGLCPRTCH